jgi:nitrogen PTS system EIIA component
VSWLRVPQMDKSCQRTVWSVTCKSAMNLALPGIGGGVSIPHARLREVQRPCGLLARLKQPVDYQAIDGQPVDLVFMLLLPASSQLDQLNALATVARKLRDQTVLRRARIAGSASELYRAMTE